MQNHKLFVLLNSLSPKEMRQLRKLVISPYFKKHGKCIEFFDLLHSLHPDFTDENLNLAVLYKILYPNEPFNSQRLRDIMSYLVEIVEHFLALSYLKQEPLEKSRILINKLYRNNMLDSLSYEIRIAEKYLKDKSKKNENALWLEYYISFITFQIKEKNEVFYGIEVNSANQVLENWLRWLYVSTLNMASELEENRSLPKSSSVFTQILTTIRNLQFQKTDLIVVAMEMIYKLQWSKKLEDYMELKNFFLEKRNELHYQVQYKCIQALFHYLLVEGFKNEALMKLDDYSLWKSIGLEIELNFTGNISSASFYNGAVELMKKRQIEQAEEFIHKYSGFLTNDVKKTILNFTLANLYFLKKDFNLSFDYLIKTDLARLGVLKMTYKQLQLMLFYERGEYSLILSYLDSFRHYIKNKGLGEKLYNSLFSSYKVFIRLVSIREKPYDKKSLEKLKTYLETLENRPNLSGWLKQKIKEMER
ncbi:MAG: hypothetical protein IPM47_18205 [Sphingobacteriales bacterium]|nr:MAG: hypothetical protein IPM47_18205 [Sphingobacteriales bacterium]